MSGRMHPDDRFALLVLGMIVGFLTVVAVVAGVVAVMAP